MLSAVAVTAAIARLAERSVFVGTSSWKYPGWLGYNETKEANEEARAAAEELIKRRLEVERGGKTKGSFVFVNNRLEGNALFTIVAVLKRLGALDEFLPAKVPGV